MFTGIIEDIGRVTHVGKKGSFVTISIESDKVTSDLLQGDSIAVDGVCLTAVGFGSNFFSADISSETVKKTTLARIHAGDRVNLERAVTPHTRLGGHLVSGHVDGTGVITKKAREGEGHLFSISANEEILQLLVVNGSVAVDGISLTVVDVLSDSFRLMIIPHTSQQTTLTSKKEGGLVNIECDMIGKYVRKFLQKENFSDQNGVTYKSLVEHGFA